MPETKVWIDPLKFTQKDFPIWVFSDNLRSFLGWGIRAHSKGNWSHCMIMTEPGMVATQGFTYKSIPIQSYMLPEYRMKFWQYPYLTNTEKADINRQVEKDLAAPWWRRNYDFLGVIGQGLHIRWLQSSLNSYCSERMADYQKNINLIKNRIPSHPSPAELNKIMIGIPEFKLRGYYFLD